MKLKIESWPPYCCVPAFVDAALSHFKIEGPSPQNLSRSLGVTVPIGVTNPWGLPEVSSEILGGLRPVVGRKTIAILLAGLTPDHGFRHIPFSTIALQLYEDVASEATRRGVVVGVGHSWSHLQGAGGQVHRHLVRLLATSSTRTRLFDDSLGVDARPFEVTWEQLERSVGVVDDGLWLIGPKSALHFDAAPRWLESEIS